MVVTVLTEGFEQIAKIFKMKELAFGDVFVAQLAVEALDAGIRDEFPRGDEAVLDAVIIRPTVQGQPSSWTRQSRTPVTRNPDNKVKCKDTRRGRAHYRKNSLSALGQTELRNLSRQILTTSSGSRLHQLRVEKISTSMAPL